MWDDFEREPRSWIKAYLNTGEVLIHVVAARFIKKTLVEDASCSFSASSLSVHDALAVRESGEEPVPLDATPPENDGLLYVLAVTDKRFLGVSQDADMLREGSDERNGQDIDVSVPLENVLSVVCRNHGAQVFLHVTMDNLVSVSFRVVHGQAETAAQFAARFREEQAGAECGTSLSASLVQDGREEVEDFQDGSAAQFLEEKDLFVDMSSALERSTAPISSDFAEGTEFEDGGPRAVELASAINAVLALDGEKGKGEGGLTGDRGKNELSESVVPENPDAYFVSTIHKPDSPVCLKCGRENQVDAVFCIDCGGILAKL